jgi:hypothetical protein
MLAEISGFAAVGLQPAAGAHGELTGVLIIRAYHRERGDAGRTKLLVPDSAHGTNPATAIMAGFEVVTIPSDARGNVDLEAVRAAVGPDTAGLMITNPNTLGLWDEHIREVVDLVHAAGGLVYNDGANFNAILGIARPGDLGIDIMHFNLHKTFSTPHGGGLEADRGEAGDLGQHLLQLAHQLERALGVRLGLVGVELGEAGEAGDRLVDLRVVLHRAGAERVDVDVDRVVLLAEAREVPDHVDLAHLGPVEPVALELGREGRLGHVRGGEADPAALGLAQLEDQRLDRHGARSFL